MEKNTLTSHTSNHAQFKHHALKPLKASQKDAFQAKLEKVVSHFERGKPFEEVRRKWTNDQVRREMQSLKTHLDHICKIIGPASKLQSHFFGLYSGFKASDDDRKAFAGFPEMVKLMRRVVEDSITNKTYKIRPSATETPCIITMHAWQLLNQFEIKATVTKKGAWFELTKYILCHACKLDERPENIMNYLKTVKVFFTQKKEE